MAKVRPSRQTLGWAESATLNVPTARVWHAGPGRPGRGPLPPTPNPGYAQGTVDAPAPHEAEVSVRINGEEHRLVLDTRVTLLDLLREELGLTGAKKGCDHGQCGACTILIDGRRANSCLALAVAHDGAEILTVEGLAGGEELHPLQRAFIEHDAFQCGYCTPGQLCSAVGMLAEAAAGHPSAASPDLGAPGPVDLDASEIRERMNGNLCRCGAYVNIAAAIGEVVSG